MQSFSEKAWACDLNGMTQRGMLIIQVKSSQVKSNQVYCYTNNTNYITPYNEYNVALHLKYMFQLHLTQLKFSIAKGAGNPVGL